MRTILLLLAFVALPCSAGQIYKCKGPKGEVIFSNIKCPEKSEVQSVSTYQPSPDSPDQLRAAHQEARRIRDRDSAVVYDQPAQSGTQRAEAAPAGFQCEANGKRWVQSAPCPATSTRRVSDSYHVDGVIAGTGEFVTGTAHGSHQETVPVSQKAISRDDLCDSIAKRERVAERGKDADSAYERRKLAHANCGR